MLVANIIAAAAANATLDQMRSLHCRPHFCTGQQRPILLRQLQQFPPRQHQQQSCSYIRVALPLLPSLPHKPPLLLPLLPQQPPLQLLLPPLLPQQPPLLPGA